MGTIGHPDPHFAFYAVGVNFFCKDNRGQIIRLVIYEGVRSKVAR
jgi:hypothetical protein